jgi:hypothetical protein
MMDVGAVQEQKQVRDSMRHDQENQRTGENESQGEAE